MHATLHCLIRLITHPYKHPVYSKLQISIALYSSIFNTGEVSTIQVNYLLILISPVIAGPFY